MALVPVDQPTGNKYDTSSCCRLFYETQINGLTLRRIIFKNMKRLCSQSGRLENRAYLDQSGSFLLTKEIKPGQTIQTDKIELEVRSRRRRSSSNLGLISYKVLPLCQIIDGSYTSTLPPTITTLLHSNPAAVRILFDQSSRKILEKHRDDQKHSMQVVVKKEPSYDETISNSHHEVTLASSYQFPGDSSSRITSSDRQKLNKLQSECHQWKSRDFSQLKSSKSTKKITSILTSVKTANENHKKLSDKLKYSHHDLEKLREDLLKQYQKVCKENSYLKTEISILSESNSENNQMDLTMDE